MCILEEMARMASSVSYRGYYYRLSHIIDILILGLLCRLQTLKDIHYWHFYGLLYQSQQKRNANILPESGAVVADKGYVGVIADIRN